MSIRASFFFSMVLLFAAPGTWLCGETGVVDAYGEQASELSQKRFEQKSWSQNKQSDLTEKSFEFKEWDLFYSPVGSKRAGISTSDSKEKKRYKTAILEFESKEMDISRWSGRLAELERQAQISTDMTLKRIDEKRLYQAAMQQADHYSETGGTLSLRDINRFQFRRNHSDSAVPVQEAGISDGP